MAIHLGGTIMQYMIIEKYVVSGRCFFWNTQTYINWYDFATILLGKMNNLFCNNISCIFEASE